MASKINTFQTRCLRIMLGIKRLDRVSNQQIYETTSSSPLMTTVTLRQLKFLGHILRMDKNELIYIYALYLPPHGKRPPGGQTMSFVNSTIKSIDPSGVLTAMFFQWMYYLYYYNELLDARCYSRPEVSPCCFKYADKKHRKQQGKIIKSVSSISLSHNVFLELLGQTDR